MSDQLQAGVARRLINPALGTGKGGLRLFGEPIQAIESDLTGTVLVFATSTAKVALIAIDLCVVHPSESDELRGAVARALDVPSAHVMLNLSHNHSSPALPEFMSMTDSPEELALRQRYKRELERALVEAAVEADAGLQPARLGTGWGESAIGVYRREFRDGRDVLGEDRGHAIDPSVGVVRVDDLDGNAIAVVFRYSAHPVSVGPQSLVASTDYPGPARDVVERCLGGLAVFIQGCGGNVNPAVGIGYEVDCRDTKNRVGMELGGEVLRVAAGIRTNTRPGARRTLGSVPNILFTPWELVDDDAPGTVAAAEESVALEFIELPALEEARAIHARWQQLLEQRIADDDQVWRIRAAKKYERWASALVAAVEDGHPSCDLRVQALRVNGVVFVGLSAETFFETGLDVRARSPFPDTFVLGYTNGLVAYLPRADDYPEGGWRIDFDYALPDLIPQAWQLPAAFDPSSADRAVDLAVSLIERLGSKSGA